MPKSDPKLQPGYGFRLLPDGQWGVEKIPKYVLDTAKVSGHLTIDGYRCTVFETKDGSQWAQKSVATAAPLEEEESEQVTTASVATPSQISERIRKIASVIESSSNPSREIIVSDLRSILTVLQNHKR